MQILYWLLIALMLVGVVGAVVPAIPGTSLILIAIIIWGIVSSSFAAIKIPLIVTIIVLILSIGVDFLAGYLGAKQAGASKWGQIGAFVGLVLGFFGLLPALPFGGPLLGILFGPLLGAIVGEYIYRREFWLAVKAGIGIVVGTLVGNLIQGVLAIATVAVFLFTTWPQVFGS
ncbi:DUF456 domain-containing protein [Anabaena sp. FACHB-709]|uniref:DUF456 domain-containing protein n=2 Tax=Nostocaceae TaxID=1162 RepID=A0A1Z4KKF1_ANAVA|nr:MULTISPECIES: DUF456 family protein [Nostocaceae]BAY69448.1 hypothetical protein NIES23_22420 [Trichormus variabilis NIES-23]HBW30125.1 DUF456 domain-containing protein [Nostoc sp. UBA8866]MBD2171086.1 DUF456 family protein [Anabaena cylindrica FACHB-318]MBD2262866.1 DUF456 family protein [Anabaena sp. FACHB-709]MBD2272336.1 DUF456 family protein [Nostoc sp. PCC 7120 = FACHB-418]